MVGSFVAFEAFAEDLTGEEARKKYQRTAKAVTPETDLILTPCSGQVIKESEKMTRDLTPVVWVLIHLLETQIKQLKKK